MIYTVGLPVELETVVKDLWALRLQLLKNKADATSDEETLFGSQPQSETETEEEGKDRRRQYKIRGKAMPTLIETLGLLYLGMVLLRLPIGMGDIHRYAREAPSSRRNTLNNHQISRSRGHPVHSSCALRADDHEAEASRGVSVGT